MRDDWLPKQTHFYPSIQKTEDLKVISNASALLSTCCLSDLVDTFRIVIDNLNQGIGQRQPFQCHSPLANRFGSIVLRTMVSVLQVS